MDKHLELLNIEKHYSGIHALKKTNLSFEKGMIYCLCGENGSGKSTLIKIISGVVKPDPGAIIIFDKKKFTSLTSRESMALGIRVIYQDLSLFPNLTVAENITFDVEISGKTLFNRKEAIRKSIKILKEMDMDIDTEAPLYRLPAAKQQIVAIARALAGDAEFLILDEPTSTLTTVEINNLFLILGKLRKKGITILFVSHKLEEVFSIGQKIIVLKDGYLLGTYEADSFDKSELVYMMTGKKIRKNSSCILSGGEIILDVKSLSRRFYFEKINFRIRRGEILGITGKIGSGRSEIALALAGILPADSGRIILAGKELKIKKSEDALRNGIIYLPENRLEEGLIVDESVCNNITLSILNKTADQLGRTDNLQKYKVADNWTEELKIQTPDSSVPVSSLSGGNQQKVVLARCLAASPVLLILDEPTAGIDIGAKINIYEIIRRLSDTGISIIIISSEEQEILNNCHRILIMDSGRIIDKADATEISYKTLTEKINRGADYEKIEA